MQRRVIRQVPDTGVLIRASQAFASATFVFPSMDDEEVTVELDMESALRVLAPLDEGEEAISELQAQADEADRERIVLENRVGFAMRLVSFMLGLVVGMVGLKLVDVFVRAVI